MRGCGRYKGPINPHPHLQALAPNEFVHNATIIDKATECGRNTFEGTNTSGSSKQMSGWIVEDLLLTIGRFSDHSETATWDERSSMSTLHSRTDVVSRSISKTINRLSPSLQTRWQRGTERRAARKRRNDTRNTTVLQRGYSHQTTITTQVDTCCSTLPIRCRELAFAHANIDTSPQRENTWCKRMDTQSIASSGP